jgi:hypothetical protein
MVRTTQNLSETLASRGRCSQMRSPGVRQAIGRNGPRMVSGAAGFMSNVSSWLGPPNSIMKMTDLARPRGNAPTLSACNTFGNDRPSSPAPAACKRCRRVMPSHVARGRLRMDSIFPPQSPKSGGLWQVGLYPVAVHLRKQMFACRLALAGCDHRRGASLRALNVNGALH